MWSREDINEKEGLLIKKENIRITTTTTTSESAAIATAVVVKVY